MRRHDFFSLSGLSVASGKRSLIITVANIILAAGSKEDFPLAEVEKLYASLHRQIFLNGIRTIIEATSQLYSLTGAIHELMVQNQGTISAMHCISYTLFHVSRTMNVVPEEQCNHMPSLCRNISNGPDVT